MIPNLDAFDHSMGRMLASTAGKVLPLKKIAITQIFTNSVSLVASAALGIMILRTEKKLSTPYRRIIFALSIAQFIGNLIWIIFPFMVPKDVPGSWGMGNKASCQASGFIFHTVTNIIPFYIWFLCWYYLCKLKYRMSDEILARKEWKLHIIIVVWNVALVTAIAATNTIHPTVLKNMCVITHTPLGCKFYPDLVGECDSANEARWILFNFILHSIKLLCLIGMIVFMSILYCHVIELNRISQLKSSERRNENELEMRSSNRDQENSNNESEENIRYLSSLYKKEVTIQGLGYIAGFVVAYIPTITVITYRYITDEDPPKFVQTLIFVLSPLHGFFNMLVYTRPQVTSLRRRHPEKSRIACFLMVLKSGGEIPDIETSTATNRSSPLGIQSIPFEVDDPHFSFSADFPSVETPSVQFSNVMLSDDNISYQTNSMVASNTLEDRRIFYRNCRIPRDRSIDMNDVSSGVSQDVSTGVSTRVSKVSSKGGEESNDSTKDTSRSMITSIGVHDISSGISEAKN